MPGLISLLCLYVINYSGQACTVTTAQIFKTTGVSGFIEDAQHLAEKEIRAEIYRRIDKSLVEYPAIVGSILIKKEIRFGLPAEPIANGLDAYFSVDKCGFYLSWRL